MSAVIALDREERRAAPAALAPQDRTDGARTVRVALAGCGVVGGAVLELLQRHGGELASGGVRFEVVRVLVREPGRPRAVALARELVTTDVDEFLAAPADIVVEAIGGVDPALRIAEAALRAGRRLVTANKALVAAHGPALAAAAAAGQGTLDFEAAVGGGVPLIRLLRGDAAGLGVRRVRGVLNGTTNYLLTRLAAGARYEAALRDAQALGLAEADPTRDVSGQDAAEKIAIVAWLALGADPRRLAVARRGIDGVAEELTALAREAGGVLRLVAECAAVEGGVVASVEPTVVDSASSLAAVAGEENVVLVESRSAGEVALRGKGAGGPPTASAIVADMLAAAVPLREPRAVAAAGEDPRLHRWLVALPPRGAHALEREAARAGLALVEAGGTVGAEIRRRVVVEAPRRGFDALRGRVAAACGGALAWVRLG